MGISYSGIDCKVDAKPVRVEISQNHPLLLLANTLPWKKMVDLVDVDLKATTVAGIWWVGRKLLLRVHLAILVLQKMFDLKDRAVIERLHTDAAFQIFCGRLIVKDWSIPVFQKVEEFRNRLSLETYVALTNIITQHAVILNLADPSMLDVDSTVQEANMSYSADGSLLQKLGKKIHKVFSWLSENVDVEMPGIIKDSLERLGALTKGYFFASKKNDQKREGLKSLHAHVKKILYKAVESFENLTAEQLLEMPSNIKLHLQHIQEQGKRYVLDVAHYLRTGTLKVGKILSFHLKEVAYINKKKLGKKAQFGREFQLGRIGGNFVIAFLMKGLRANDKNAMESFVSTHKEAFGEGILATMTADRGYYSRANINATSAVPEVSLGYQWKEESDQDFRRLYARRAGIEPIIGHIKQGGQLGRSRMKSDAATHKAGYGAMLGFNLRQMMKKL